ncbi:MAG: ADP-glyceromanno-heptose 6-epimerase, partial [Bacteroidales bacterium]|nr:ADP-glyceromanno-heptose 6-epimerase [Bacteroidales bacterium]
YQNPKDMIVVTGAAGFIGSCMTARLNEAGYKDIVLVDDFSRPEKARNLEGRQFTAKVHRDEFFPWLEAHHKLVQIIIHLGARTDTTEMDMAVFDRLNLNYTKQVWTACVRHALPLIYASSAATYGAGELGYEDRHDVVDRLQPLNPYGISKNEFDKWALRQPVKPFFWAGLKFFNVYGPNEYHKGRMASVVLHAFRQIGETGGMKLFRSHRPDFKDGEQLRDFVYVKDVTSVILFLMTHRQHSGLYNVGTGTARTFLDLARATFRAMGREERISFIDTPADIRDRYQYFTEAAMQKLRGIGYDAPFHSLEAGITDYVQNYLMPDRCW